MRSLLVALSLLLAVPSYAAQITVIKNENVTRLRVDGEIAEKDSEKFVALLKQHPEITVIELNSNGGLVYEGLVMGAAVHDRRLSTLIRNKEHCLSICSVVFLSGYVKFIYPESKLGVHTAKNAITNKRDDKTNTVIAWYFGSLGYPLGLVDKWVNSEPDSINSITLKENIDFNLGIVMLNGQD